MDNNILDVINEYLDFIGKYHHTKEISDIFNKIGRLIKALDLNDIHKCDMICNEIVKSTDFENIRIRNVDKKNIINDDNANHLESAGSSLNSCLCFNKSRINTVAKYPFTITTIVNNIYLTIFFHYPLNKFPLLLQNPHHTLSLDLPVNL